MKKPKLQRTTSSQGKFPFELFPEPKRNPGGRFYRFNGTRSDRVYRLRFECDSDLSSLLRMLESLGELIHAEVLSFRYPILLPECSIQVRTLTTLEHIRGLCRGVEDGHVMVQTIQTPRFYTGTRNWHV